METALFAIICDPRSSAIIWKPALNEAMKKYHTFLHRGKRKYDWIDLKTETFTRQLIEINIFIAQTSHHKYIVTKVVVIIRQCFK